MIGIIGGSGFEKFDGFDVLEVLDRETPFGDASYGLQKVRVADKECLFVSRHGDHHELLPSEVNYRANIFALKRAGAKAIVSISAVGSLTKDCAPGDLVVPFQYIDRTKSLRKTTFCGDGVIGHVSLAKPMCEVMAGRLEKICAKQDFKSHFKKTYVCVEGPYFSTRAESHSYRDMGVEVIGMSNFPEYGLAREAGLPYLPCCFVTDYDCWDDSIPHVTIEEVMRIMKANNAKAFTLLQELVSLGEDLWKGSEAPEAGLRTGLFMPREAVPARHKAWLDIVLG